MQRGNLLAGSSMQVAMKHKYSINSRGADLTVDPSLGPWLIERVTGDIKKTLVVRDKSRNFYFVVWSNDRLLRGGSPG